MDIAGTSGHAAELTASAGRYPLSANLELFCMFDKGDEQGALGPRHLMVTGWRVTGPVSEDRLTAALDAVVARHEMLRTEVSRGRTDQYQEVHPPARSNSTSSTCPRTPAARGTNSPKSSSTAWRAPP